MKKSLIILFSYSLFFATNTLYSSHHIRLAYSLDLQSMDKDTLSLRSLSSRYFHSLPKDYLPLQHTFNLIIYKMAEENGVYTHIPNELTKLIINYYMESFKTCKMLQDSEEIASGRYIQSYVLDLKRVKEKINARILKVFSLFCISMPNTDIYLESPRHLNITMSNSTLNTFKINRGHLDDFSMQNVTIGSMHISDSRLWKKIAISNSKFKSFHFEPDAHKAYFLDEREVMLKDVQIDKNFVMQFTNPKARYSIHQMSLSVDNLHLSEKCQVTITPNVRILSISSRFTNAPKLKEALVNNIAPCCCEGCCGCWNGSWRYGIETCNIVTHKHYAIPPWCDCNIYCSSVSLSLLCCIPLILIGASRVSIDYLRTCLCGCCL